MAAVRMDRKHIIGVAHVQLGVLLLFASSVGAADKDAALSGRVVDITGAPLRFARVCLYRSDSTQQCENYTDVNGQFHIEELQPGMYKVTITRGGFREKTTPEMQIASGRKTNLGSSNWISRPAMRKVARSATKFRPSKRET
jgi:hypothetical protein